MTVPRWDGPRRLWSLWEMLNVNAEAFVEAADYLGRLRMVAEQVFRAQTARDDPERKLTAVERQSSGLDERLVGLRSQCDPLEMRLTIKHINRCLNDADLTPQSVYAFCVEIFTRFRDELSERRFFSLHDSYVPYYEKPLACHRTLKCGH